MVKTNLMDTNGNSNNASLSRSLTRSREELNNYRTSKTAESMTLNLINDLNSSNFGLQTVHAIKTGNSFLATYFIYKFESEDYRIASSL
jgi:hypothetical protein